MLGQPTCTLYNAKVLTKDCCLNVLVYNLFVGTLRCWAACCAHQHLCCFRLLSREVAVSPTCWSHVGSTLRLFIHVGIFSCCFMVLVEINDVLSHVGVGIDKFQDRWVATKMLWCLGSPVWKLNALLERTLVLQDLVQMLLNLCWHPVECLRSGVLQAVDEGLVPSMLRSSHLLNGHGCVVMPNKTLLPTCCIPVVLAVMFHSWTVENSSVVKLRKWPASTCICVPMLYPLLKRLIVPLPMRLFCWTLLVHNASNLACCQLLLSMCNSVAW